MPITTYSLKQHGEHQVSPHLKVKEFACSGTDVVKLDDILVELVQDVRDHFGLPVEINSGYRTPAANKGSPRSQHMAGAAADIHIKGVRPREIAKYAMTLPKALGVGLYEYGPGEEGFCHIDTGAGDASVGVPKRTKPTRWYQDNKNGPEKAMPNLNSPIASRRTLRKGDKGEDVKALQAALGITADGMFGTYTEGVVRAFQQMHGLVGDGIVGIKTWAALGVGG